MAVFHVNRKIIETKLDVTQMYNNTKHTVRCVWLLVCGINKYAATSYLNGVVISDA